MGVAHEVLFPDELELTVLLGEAAERFDDAHQEWLEKEVERLEAHLECMMFVK